MNTNFQDASIVRDLVQEQFHLFLRETSLLFVGGAWSVVAYLRSHQNPLPSEVEGITVTVRGQ